MTIQTFTAGQTLTAAQMNTLQASDFNFTRNVQAGTSYTMVLADKGKLLEFENTGSITLTIPTNAAAAFDIGDRVDVLLTSTGSLSIVGDTGVTLNAEGDLTTIASQWTRVTLIKRGINSWVLTGSGAEVQTVEIENGAVTEAKLASNSVTSAKIVDGTIVNADINASAAIALSKLATSTAGNIIVYNSSGVPTAVAETGDVTISDTGVTSIASGVIVNADINASAAIALTKLATGTQGTVIVHNASGVPTATAISGDITISNTGVATIAANSVALGTDTTGNYMSDLTQGTGVTITHTPGEGSNATIAIGQSVATSANPTFAGATLDAVQVGITAANEIDTTSGNLILDSFTGTVQIDDNVSVTGTLVARAAATQDGVQLQGRAGGTGTFEVTITPTTLTADRTLTLPDASGTIALVGGLGGVTLGTDTNGNYVASLVEGTGVTITNNTGEGATPTIAIGQAIGTSASVTFGQVTTTGNIVVGGNLTVNGTTTTLNTDTLAVEDNIIVLNSNVTAAPALNAGVEVERGTSANVLVRWNETNDKWEVTNDGTTYGNIVTTSSSTVEATSANTANAVVSRDASGNFTAGTATLTSASVSGRFDGTSIREAVVDSSVSASVVTADYSTGDIFYVGTAPASNFTVNLTNAPTDNGKAITVVIFVTQGATGYIPNAVQVAGSAQTIKWANGAAPTPTSSAGKIDIFSFTFVRRSSAWTVFGSSNLGY
jgi:hypothetical protein